MNQNLNLRLKICKLGGEKNDEGNKKTRTKTKNKGS